MRLEFTSFIPIAKAIVALMKPHVEVVIHDLEKGTIAGIYNNFSKRKVGDPSYIDLTVDRNSPEIFPPYIKTGLKGNRIKSVSAVIKDHSGHAVGIFCINVDIFLFDKTKALIESFTLASENLPSDLFKDDWKEKLNQFVYQYASGHSVDIYSLSPKERLSLIQTLLQKGALKQKHAKEHLAHILKVSRATIYKDMQSIR